MITFQKLRWKNFMSYGNTWTSIDFTSHPTTLIVGDNGSGKSTMLDALTFALYGKPFRDINKGQMVNSITRKGTLVDLGFTLGSSTYMIRRGIKPNVFEIIKDGKAIDQQAHMRDQQEMLETSILKMNQKSFSQIVVLGLANFIPFMRLSTPQRRQVIEDLLDIQIFSVMNTMLKDRISQNKLDIQSNESDRRLVESKTEMHEKYVKELQQNYEEQIKELGDKVADNKRLIPHIEVHLKENEKAVDKLETKLKERGEIRSAILKLDTNEPMIAEKVTKIQNAIKFYSTNDECPTCQQHIDADFKEKELSEKNSALKKMADGLETLRNKKTELTHSLEEYTEVTTNLGKLNAVVNQDQIKIMSTKRLIESQTSEIKSLKQKKHPKEDHTKDELKKEVEAVEKARAQIIHTREVFIIAGKLLKDGGIKAKIIKQYVPILNKLINRYLQALDFFVEFHINEEFKETIKSRHRDEFSYESFSQGEKLRIDLSLMFTWRAVAKLRNSATTNLLILDEILDSSLDDNGVEDFIQIIKTLTAGTNTFIISHKLDQSQEFDRLIQFEKRDNFSRIAA